MKCENAPHVQNVTMQTAAEFVSNLTANCYHCRHYLIYSQNVPINFVVDFKQSFL